MIEVNFDLFVPQVMSFEPANKLVKMLLLTTHNFLGGGLLTTF